MAQFRCKKCGAVKSETPGCHECRAFGMECVAEAQLKRLRDASDDFLRAVANYLDFGKGEYEALKEARRRLYAAMSNEQ
jgi:hypothetical protein